ncbi:hypothetical protein FisN_4Lh136 [Fistulifera solaris]|uniref:Uncharacterized protein n=1 Tax=Fistulifera solaris TaxID=1519565 RepID=A0A1Z5JZ56_FISSO|nr:hypothetical protein FisN_4Lh136 [Fistulifera solaris]|eukprot:GAX19287.1 hypothetical protein FisN_4Lh136 [Fistulifera solaris]
MVDAALIAKWKKKGYERLCSTYVINPSNYKFGTTSICRVPWFDRSEEQKKAQDPTTGCRGCASGKGAGPRNIFGNKYGQNLAAVQVAREKRLELKRKQEEERKGRKIEQKKNAGEDETDDDDGNAETDSDSEDDYGPTPTAGIWAGTQQLEKESERLADPDGEAETDDEYDDENEERPSKKARAD